MKEKGGRERGGGGGWGEARNSRQALKGKEQKAEALL